jgi:PAS domain S-box-containing protein
MINMISLMDLVSLLAAFFALILLFRGWRKKLGRDAFWVLTMILVMTIYHSLSNFVEWSGISPAYDTLEDFLQLLWPILWGLFIYVFVRNREEGQLAGSQERYHSLFEDSPIALLEEDFSEVKRYLDGLRASGVSDFRAYLNQHPEAAKACAGMVKILDVNQSALALMRADRKDDLQRGLSLIFDPESFDAFVEELAALAEGKTYYETQAIRRTLKGDQLNVRLSLTLAPSEIGTWARVYVSIIDISQLVRTQEALREANLIVENSPAVLFLWGAGEGWPIELVSENVRQFGYTPEEMLSGQVTYTSIIHPDDLPRISREFQEFVASGKDALQQEYRILTKDGGVRWLDDHTTIERDSSEGISRFQGIVIDISDRKQVELALHESETKYRSMVENALAGVFTIDDSYHLVYVNEALCALLGYSRQELEGMDFRQFITDDYKALVAERYFRRQRAEIEPTRYEIDVLRKDGQVRHVGISAAVVLDEDNRPRTIGQLVDITERKQAEKEREVLQRLALDLTAPLNLKDLARLLAAHCRELFSYDSFRFDLYDEKEDLRTPVYAEDTPPGGQAPVDVETDTDARLPQSIQAIFETKAVLMNREGGNISDDLNPWGFAERRSRSMMFAPVRWQERCLAVIYTHSYVDGRYDDRDLGLLQLLADQCGPALARVQAMEALHASEERYRTLFDHTNDAVFIIGLDDIHLAVNQRAADLLGYRVEEMVGMSVEQIVAAVEYPDSQEKKKALFAGRSLPPYERFFRHKDGHLIPVEVSVGLVYDRNGEPDYIQSIARDITERKQREEEIRRLNAELEQRVIDRTRQLEAANKELEAFAYSVSHDLRAPLRAMDGFTSILLEEYVDQIPIKAQDYLRRVGANARRMGQLIEDLLAFSRLGRTELVKRRLAPDELARQVASELQEEQANRRVEIQIADLPPCYADSSLLKQVFANLLGNAVKFSRDRDPAFIEVGCEQKEGQQIYFVKDNGVGFDMRYADKLFGVFQRLHHADEYEGEGVGLAIVQRIIHRHGGRVWVKAREGDGATFYFTLSEPLPESRLDMP